jgi:hypothetical protein
MPDVMRQKMAVHLNRENGLNEAKRLNGLNVFNKL